MQAKARKQRQKFGGTNQLINTLPKGPIGDEKKQSSVCFGAAAYLAKFHYPL